MAVQLPFSIDAVLESLNEGFQAFDRAWRYVYLNHRAEQMLGRARDTLLGEVCWEVFPEAKGTDFHARYREAMELGRPLVFESFCPHEKRWQEFSLHPFPGGLAAFTRDITERKQAEEALRQSEQQYRSLFDQVQSAVVLVNDQGQYIDANPAACDMFGLPCQELKGRTLLEFAPPGTAASVKESWRTFLQTGEQTGEFVLWRPDGTQRMLEYRAHANVRPGIHLSLLRDVTERRQAEDQARHLLAALQEERDTLDTVNRVGRLLSAELDLHKLVQAATDAATELTGAQFGAFFYNAVNEQGESLLLYTISGAPLEAFSQFPHPRATPLFGPTFRGEGIIRSGDITKDPRYGTMEPHHGMPKGHLPVRSYLAVPVVSRSGEVLGGLFFGHSDSDVFTDRAERNLVALVAQVAVAVDNARLYGRAQREIAERRKAEETLARQARFAALRADISAALAVGGPLRNILMPCAAYLVEHLDATLARVWTLDAKEQVLVLQASAGMEAQTDEEQSRIPLGMQNIIALIAEDKTPYWSNDLQTDDRILEKAWAHHAGITAFGGYPLLLEERVIGVAAVFTRHPLPPDTHEAMASIAGALAQGIERKQVEQRLAESEARQRGFLQDALASVTGGRLRLCESATDLPERLPVGTGGPLELTAESLRVLRRRTRVAAEAAGLNATRSNDLLTAVGEAAMNAVSHARNGVADIRADVEVGVVQVWVEDQGRGIEIIRLPQATLQRGYTTAGTLGHGFKMMLQTADRLWLLTGPLGTTIVLEQGREAPLPNWLTET